jgi:hypothetical protein
MNNSEIVEFVMAAIKLKAMGIITNADDQKYPAVDFVELGKRLRQSGALENMISYATNAPEMSVMSVWRSTPEAIKILRRMRLEAMGLVEV